MALISLVLSSTLTGLTGADAHLPKHSAYGPLLLLVIIGAIMHLPSIRDNLRTGLFNHLALARKQRCRASGLTRSNTRLVGVGMGYPRWQIPTGANHLLMTHCI